MRLTAYSKESEQIFQDILKMHPKFKPKNMENAHHIWCLNSDLPADSTVTVEEMKPLATFLSVRLDIPVSVFVDRHKISIAIFWDSRVLG